MWWEESRKHSLFYFLMRWLGICFRPFSPKVISFFVVNLTKMMAVARSPKEGLRLVFTIEKALYGLTGSEAIRYGNGLHTKHRHTKYHDFFCNRLRAGETVLDIGCGNGALAHDMAEKAGAVVTGIELSEKNYRNAVKHFSHARVTFIYGDALKDLHANTFETIVMSNVLEHLEDRIGFLIHLQKRISPRRWLFRVPLYERDWRVPLMEEIGVDYRLDPGHYIEYTREGFVEEISLSGLKEVEMDIRWGEIWCEAVPK